MIFKLNAKKTMFAAMAACTVISTAAVAGGMENAPTSDSVANDGSFESAILNGTAYINTRYRFENVDVDGNSDEANASTLRTNLGYKTGTWNDFSAVIEVQNITEIGDSENNDSINGDSRPVVADPASTEINEAKIIYTGLEDTTFILGRQKVDLDNQRHIGTVGFRQNDQTYDAFAVVNSSIEDVTALYGYVNNVNRINGDDHAFGNLDTETHLVNIAYTGLEYGKLTAYGYFIDLDDVALTALSSKTFGARFAGKTNVDDGIDATYAVEYATQEDHGDNATNYDADYYLAELGLAGGNWDVTVGYEELGSDNGTASFQTPLGTNHAFNGAADIFVGGTPVNGLEDLYIKASYKVEGTDSFADGIKLAAAFHTYEADEGSADYGDEWNVKICKKITENYSASLAYADYNADQFSVDTQKIWLTLGAKF